jgi:hypothetical protein
MIDILIVIGILGCFAALAKILIGTTTGERVMSFYVMGCIASLICLIYSILTLTLMPVIIGIAWLVQVYIIAETVRRTGE